MIGRRIITSAAKIIGILRILCEYAALTPLAKRKTLCNGGGGGNLRFASQSKSAGLLSTRILFPDAHSFPAHSMCSASEGPAGGVKDEAILQILKHLTPLPPEEF